VDIKEWPAPAESGSARRPQGAVGRPRSRWLHLHEIRSWRGLRQL